jgi:hypothetical protein
MKYLVVKYTNGCFYGFNLVVKNERQTATNFVADVNNNFTITGWRMSKNLPSWALSYQEWQSFISAGESCHVGEIEAFTVDNNKDESDKKHMILLVMILTRAWTAVTVIMKLTVRQVMLLTTRRQEQIMSAIGGR